MFYVVCEQFCTLPREMYETYEIACAAAARLARTTPGYTYRVFGEIKAVTFPARPLRREIPPGAEIAA